MVLVTVVFIFVVTQDQSAEALRILADPNGSMPEVKIIAWLASVGLLAVSVYLSTRATTILHEKSEPIIAPHTQKIDGYFRMEPVWNIATALILAGLMLAGASFSLAAAIDFASDWADAASPDRLLAAATTLCGLAALIVLGFGLRYLVRKTLDSFDVGGDRGQIPAVRRQQMKWCLGGFGAILLGNIVFPFLPAPFVIIVFFGALLAGLVLLFELSFRLTFNIPGFLIVAALLLSAANLTDNHTIRDLPRQTPSTACAAPDAAEAFTRWLAARPDRDRFTRYPVFIVAAEGGGMRAGYMTIEALRALEAKAPGFADHLFAIVGVSGGSVGAALYAASRQGEDWEQWARGSAAAATALKADLLSPVMTGLLGPDLLARVLPFDAFDRARWLEDALDDAWTAAGQKSLAKLGFADVWSPASRAPALILMGTRVDGRLEQSGTRLAFSHVRFRDGPATVCELAPSLHPPLLTAALASARFPIVSPAATIPAPEGPVRLVDGGYFENSGVTTILDLRRELASALSTGQADLYVIRINNSAATTAVRWQAGATTVATSFSELLSPFRAALGTRNARAELAVQELGRSMPTDHRAAIELAPSNVPVPLGWWLSNSADNEIDRQINAPANASAFGMAAGALATRLPLGAR
jgi:predicted acylesterase/phospholipase RssA